MINTHLLEYSFVPVTPPSHRQLTRTRTYTRRVQRPKAPYQLGKDARDLMCGRGKMEYVCLLRSRLKVTISEVGKYLDEALIARYLILPAKLREREICYADSSQHSAYISNFISLLIKAICRVNLSNIRKLVVAAPSPSPFQPHLAILQSFKRGSFTFQPSIYISLHILLLGWNGSRDARG
jgi:hypothetical protein